MWNAYRANYGPIWPNTGGTTPTTYTLNITAANGTVTKSPNKTSYSSGEVVTLTATPNTGYTFGSWSGGATGTSATTPVTMNANKTVTATFTAVPYTLTATAANGTVSKSPSKATYTYGETEVQALLPNPVVETPPSGMLNPINAFGRVWGNLSNIRSELGWATASEHAYTATKTNLLFGASK